MGNGADDEEMYEENNMLGLHDARIRGHELSPLNHLEACAPPLPYRADRRGSD